MEIISIMDMIVLSEKVIICYLLCFVVCYRILLMGYFYLFTSGKS